MCQTRPVPMDPPPPPPPHGSNAGNKSGLPPGNYDIFIIPPHSSGSGFLYLPSLQTHRNSFLAGVACTLTAIAIWTIVFPVLKEWFSTIVASGGMGVFMLLIGVGVAGWAWGKTQMETGGSAKGGAGGVGGGSNTYANGSAAGAAPDPSHGGMPGASAGPPPGAGSRAPPKPTWQRSNTTPNNASGTTGASAGAGAAKGGWEKAREETRKKEEERKKAEELRKKREEDEKERVKQREKDAREREARERREKELREGRERREREARDKVRDPTSPRKTDTSRPSSPTKNHRQPTAKTATDDDASYSFRPYDKPKRPLHKTTSASSVYSESSYAPSQSTARTTPPPSHRGPYHTKDPDKIVIKAVYSFNNAFTKLPVAQLVSGMGSVTDGLILRITTEGLFIDDDVRGVPQREWDVKAWTMKLVEVWCPCFSALGASSGSGFAASSRSPPAGRSSFFGSKGVASKAPTAEETDAFVDGLLAACKAECERGFSASKIESLGKRSNASFEQSGEYKGLHVLRASIRDQEGKRYLFVLQEEEGWKVAVGLQRLRRGTQVRALGVSGMAANETKAILEGMGWV